METFYQSKTPATAECVFDHDDTELPVHILQTMPPVSQESDMFWAAYRSRS